MKKTKSKVFIMIAAILLCIVGYLFYSKPMTIQQRYPMLTLDKCVEITGYYEIGTQEETTQFVIEKDSKEFEELFAQFYDKSYHRSLKDILPRGTRTHRTESDDFQWDVYFTFEDVEFPNGSSGSGVLLHFKNWYGDLDIYFDDDRYSCYTKEQETWLNDVLDIIK